MRAVLRSWWVGGGSPSRVSEVLACLVAAAVFKTVASDVERSMGGFDSHALPLRNGFLGETLVLILGVLRRDELVAIAHVPDDRIQTLMGGWGDLDQDRESCLDHLGHRGTTSGTPSGRV